jgi:serine/threonine protein phosphatase PrpC
MSAFSKTIEVTCATEKNYKGQDQPFSGTTLSGKTYFGIWDGHGSDHVIDELRRIMNNGKLGEFMDLEEPINKVADYLVEKKICPVGECSGATMNFGIIDNHTLSCINCGDSRMFVFKNGELIFMSEDHNSSNEKERKRLGSKVYYTPSRTIKVIAENKMIGVKNEYIHYEKKIRLAVSQAVGHNNITGISPDTTRIEFEPADEIVAVSVSDGVLDMLLKNEQNLILEQDIRMIYSLSANDLVAAMQSRWLQEWNMPDETGAIIETYTYSKRDCDDIGVCRLVIHPAT